MSKQAQNIAEDYYDSPDADAFYREIWGGEDIHVGIYDEDDSIAEASHRTVLEMASRLRGLKPDARVLDMGAGYGGAARVLAGRFGASVACLNLSEAENARNRALTREQGLEARVQVIHGAFEDIPFPDESFDIVWSQDAFLHSGERARALSEAARILRPGGELIFTDPMQADNITDTSGLQPIYDRLHLPNLASVAFYRKELAKNGFEEIKVVEMPDQLTTHYASVAQALKQNRDSLHGKVSDDYIDRMLSGLSHWVKAGTDGRLNWGILHFLKS